MENKIDIKFFPNEVEKNNYLGGGYITSGVLKTKFSVFRNSKFNDGFSVSLPSTKEGNEWINHVEFPTRIASDYVYDYIKPFLSKFFNGGTQVDRTSSNTPTQESVKNKYKKSGTPF